MVGSGALTAATAGIAYWGYKEREQKVQAEENSVESAIAKEAVRTDIVGQFVAYAASPGQVAEEGPRGGNSPYTAELLARLSNRSVSLYEACFAGNLNVQQKSKTQQRPFLSTDMNGNIYLMRQPETRIRKAIIVSVDRLYSKGDLYNTMNDGLAWEAFLKDKCGFEVLRIANPEKDSFHTAFDDLSLQRSTKQGRLGSSPLLHKAGFTGRKIEPVENALLRFVYSGFGAYRDGGNYLMTDDANLADIDRRDMIDHANEWVEMHMMSLTWIQDRMRQAAAASILILDSNFPDIDKALNERWNVEQAKRSNVEQTR